MAHPLIMDKQFEPLGDTPLEDHARVTLANAAERLRALLGEMAFERLHFMVSINSIGQILLTPYVATETHESWLQRNPLALSQVRQGIAQAGRNETVHSGAFAEFADEDPTDE